MKKENVNILYTQNETKANYAERVIRTMKNMMYRYLKKKTINIRLQGLVKSYNNRPHRMLGGFSPASVNKNNAAEVRYTSYLTRKKKKTPTRNL